MKKTLIAISVIVLMLLIAFGIWGYVKAQDVKKQAKNLEQITSDTLTLSQVETNNIATSLAGWKALSDKASLLRGQLESIEGFPSALKDDLTKFYSAQAQDKYVEVQYLQLLAEGQSSMDLKSASPKSKGQIESVLQRYDELQNGLSRNNLALGPSFNALLAKTEQEASAFRKSASDIHDKMTYESPSVQLSTAGFDKAIDELKMAIANDLNEWVSLQGKIKGEMTDLGSANWINPLNGTKK